MRIAFFAMLFANLAFLAWSVWIDVPQPAAANDVYAKLPRLKLVGEDVPASSAGGAASGKIRKTSLSEASSVARCFTVGPFDDEAGGTRVTAPLREKGLALRARSVQGEVSKGFWVYVGGLKTDHDVNQVLLTLTQAHVDDAKVMQAPASAEDHRVSVGVFSDRDRADRRANSIKKLGLEPQVAERKVPGMVVWMDMDVPAGSVAPGLADLTAPAPQGVAVIPCATGASPASASPGGSAPAAAPGPLAPAPTAPFRTKVATGSPPKTP